MKRFLIVLLAAVNVQAMTLDEYISAVKQNNKQISSYDISVEASNERQVAGDLGLSPLLTAGYSVTSDKSLPSSVADERITTVTTLGLSKIFSTGTTLGVSANTYKYENKIPVTPGNDEYYKGGLGVSLSQSLWRNSFGAGTRLRHDRESAVNKYEVLNLELQRRTALTNIESDYWDYMVAQENLKLKQDNLDRSKKLQNWTSNRVSNGISDQSDLLQVKALTGLREVDLATAADLVRTRESKIRENLNLAEGAQIPQLTTSMTESRPYFNALAQQKNIVRIDTYLTALDAQIKKASAEEVVDSLRPDLSVFGQYNTSSYSTNRQEMQDNIAKTDRPVTAVGVNFSWYFGSDAKGSQLSSAKKEAAAAELRAQQARISGQNAWADYLRKYELAKQNVMTLEKIAEFQRGRFKAEQAMFSKGRTITTNVVTAETDSAQADINYLQAKADLRKMEAGTQLFMAVSE